MHHVRGAIALALTRVCSRIHSFSEQLASSEMISSLPFRRKLKSLGALADGIVHAKILLQICGEYVHFIIVFQSYASMRVT